MIKNTIGRRKVEAYLSGRLSLFGLNDWSLEFGDDPADSDDADSMDIAGLVTELVHDLGTGEIDEHVLRQQLADRIGFTTASHGVPRSA
jgi:hypothetical protein